MNLLDRILYRWLFRSLANQLLITYLLVITIALAAVSFWALVAIRKESLTDLQNTLEVEAVNLGLEIDNDLELDSPKARKRIQSAVDRRATRLGVAIVVVDKDGRLLADSSEPGPVENLSKEQEINEALAGVISKTTRSDPDSLKNWMYVACPVRSSGTTTGVIRVGVPLTEIERRLKKDLFVFLEIILATGVVTVLISLWLARRVNRPVREMSALAKQISISGDFSAFLPVRRRDEIGELCLSFNQMIGRLREQERVRQEFISNASHELKTPTMAIGSVVEALQAGAAEDPKLRVQFLGSLERLVDRQTNLIQDLLDISKLDSGSETNWQSEVNISQVISDAVDQVRPQAEKKELAISTQITLESGGQDLVLVGNANQLQRALLNILTNAVKYTPANGFININVRSMGGERLEIRIQDSGGGIDPADLPRIFERFYRADKARTRESGNPGGTGLGLAIVREIVARHHGTVEVESVVGKGSTFVILLPLRPDNA
ncbi:MAG: Histidine kinase [Cyanobacteriota bacterium erpe_2018_sw_21hr_WHONDRS-SW48-000092_B_bin.40]|nr:Histidine kinase [Cyanobacteriota bacterium erpe_2018_sw_21hr_WHONDRS-SW48-000092_B_bin.40]